jgi:oligopeptide transport system permease protein
MKYNENGTPKKNTLSMQLDLSKFEPATEEDKRQQDVMSESTSFFRDGMKKLFKNLCL